MAAPNHENIDVLRAIVDGHGKEIAEIRVQIANVGETMGGLIRSLSEKIDAQRQDVYANSRPDYKGLIAAGTGVAAVFVSVFITIGSMALSPIREEQVNIKADAKSNIALQQNRNLAMEQATAKVADELIKTEVQLATLIGSESERHDQYLRDDAKHEMRENTIDAALIKRPEIESILAALGTRIDAISVRATELQREFGANFTLGDAVKELQARINALQLQTNVSLTPASPKAAD